MAGSKDKNGAGRVLNVGRTTRMAATDGSLSDPGTLSVRSRRERVKGRSGVPSSSYASRLKVGETGGQRVVVCAW